MRSNTCYIIYNELINDSLQITNQMEVLQMQNIKHVLNHNGHYIELGQQSLNSKIIGDSSERFKHEIKHEHLHVKKIATAETPGNIDIYMYRVLDTETGEWTYYIVNNECLHYDTPDGVKYHEYIIYDKPMNAEFDIEAFREFAEIYAEEIL